MSALARHSGQELARVLEHCDRFAVRVTARRVLGRHHQIPNGALAFAALFEMERELGRQLAIDGRVERSSPSARRR